MSRTATDLIREAASLNLIDLKGREDESLEHLLKIALEGALARIETLSDWDSVYERD